MDCKSQICKLVHLNQLSLLWWQKPELKDNSFVGFLWHWEPPSGSHWFYIFLCGGVTTSLRGQRKGSICIPLWLSVTRRKSSFCMGYYYFLMYYGPDWCFPPHSPMMDFQIPVPQIVTSSEWGYLKSNQDKFIRAGLGFSGCKLCWVACISSRRIFLISSWSPWSYPAFPYSPLSPLLPSERPSHCLVTTDAHVYLCPHLFTPFSPLLCYPSPDPQKHCSGVPKLCCILECYGSFKNKQISKKTGTTPKHTGVSCTNGIRTSSMLMHEHVS